MERIVKECGIINKIVQLRIIFCYAFISGCGYYFIRLVIYMLESINQVVHTFSKACAIECNILDMREPDGYEKRLISQYCSWCVKEQIKRFKTVKCENLHFYSACQSERWGGKYEYLCPAGLAFICTTIFNEGELQQCVYAGPFLMVDYDEFINEDLDSMYQGLLPGKLLSEARKLSFIDSSRVSSLADILLSLALQAKERRTFELKIMEEAANSAKGTLEIRGANSTQYPYPIEQEKLLQGFIASGDKASGQKVLNDILGHIFFCSGGDFQIIKARVTELVVLLSRAAIEGGASVSEILGLNHDCFLDISRFENPDDLNIWLSKVLLRFTNAVFNNAEVKHSDLIKRIIQYIRSNYMRKLSLNDISDSVNFSVSYICKLFKDEMNMSLTNYINQIRIENAKILLHRNDIALVDVSLRCGFEDQSYFTKVFKKSTGITPGTFREKHSHHGG